MSLDQRKCRLRNENPNPESMFKYYTQKSCQFECALATALKNSGCIPFNMPHLYKEAGDEALCTRDHLAYFEQNMTDSSTLSHCDCLPDCEGVTFSYTTNTLQLDPDEECLKEAVLDAAWDNVNTVSDQLAWRVLNLHQATTPLRDADPLDFDPLTRCKRKVKNDFAIIVFELGKPDVIQMVRTAKFSLVAILTLIGDAYNFFMGLVCLCTSYMRTQDTLSCLK